MAETSIRQASAADTESVVACVRSAYAVYVPRIGREPAPMTADYASLIARRVVWVFEDFSGVLVAYPGNGSFFIENVAVRPEQQGQGLGRRLLDFAEQLCREHGFAELRLYTHVKMTENRAMYAHMGYTEVDRRHEHGFERVYMLKRLTPKAAAQR